VPRRTLVLGGTRSGKSAEAERLLAELAGDRPDDAEWTARVAAHRDRRPPHWRTAETTELVPLLRTPGGGPLLIDCLSLWLTAVLDQAGAWDDDTWAAGARAQVADRVAALTSAWQETPGPVVAVSGEVGMGVVPATPAGRRFADELGRLNAVIAGASDQVLLVVAGQVLRIR
jgi:adenosylcobinamide kinase/adenosylcobinamide-phosphate guanylyltransferase